MILCNKTVIDNFINTLKIKFCCLFILKLSKRITKKKSIIGTDATKISILDKKILTTYINKYIAKVGFTKNSYLKLLRLYDPFCLFKKNLKRIVL